MDTFANDEHNILRPLQNIGDKEKVIETTKTTATATVNGKKRHYENTKSDTD